MVCPSESRIAAFAGGRLQPAAADPLRDHLDGCAPCRTLIAELVRGAGSTLMAQVAAPRLDDTDVDLDKLVRWRPGLKLAGRFRLIRLLGRGGMGEVFEAEDGELAVRVALKLLPCGISGQETYLQFLHREIRLGRAITHPNVCRIFDYGSDGCAHFITMELVEGVTLAEHLRRGVPTEPAATTLLRQILGALAAAHAGGVTHRDLKPGNVMLDAHGQIKVMDFGLARESNARSSGVGPVGTPGYWSPEQALGGRVGPATDVYSFGVLAFEILTGRQPSAADRLRPRELPRGWRRLIARCLRVDPRERFRDAGELERAHAAQGRSHRLPAAGLAAALAASAAGLVLLAGVPGVELAAAVPRRAASSSASPQVGSSSRPLPIVRPLEAPPVVASLAVAALAADPAATDLPSVADAIEAPADDRRGRRRGHRHRRGADSPTAPTAAAAPATIAVADPVAATVTAPAPVAAVPAVAVEETPLASRAREAGPSEVKRRLERATRMIHEAQLAPAQAASLRLRMQRVHTAYFDEDYARANGELDGIFAELRLAAG